MNLADAVVRLRPAWVRVTSSDPVVRAGDPAVFVNETFVGGIGELRLISLERADAVGFLTASSGFARFGRNCRCAGGVVLVFSRER